MSGSGRPFSTSSRGMAGGGTYPKPTPTPFMYILHMSSPRMHAAARVVDTASPRRMRSSSELAGLRNTRWLLLSGFSPQTTISSIFGYLRHPFSSTATSRRARSRCEAASWVRKGVCADTFVAATVVMKIATSNLDNGVRLPYRNLSCKMPFLLIRFSRAFVLK